MSLVTIKINGRLLQVEDNLTIYQAARQNKIDIPTLCYLKDINNSGACRVCMVEVKGQRNLASACNYPVREGLEVFTHSKRAIEARKNTVELIMSNHCDDCLSCVRNQNCELQRLAQELNIRHKAFHGEKTAPHFDNVANGIVRDTSKCVLCGRCIETCKKVQGLGILGFSQRGFKTTIGPVFDKSFADVNCMQCGQCVNACPVGALTEKENIHEVIEALNNPNQHVIVQTAPAVRASLAEEFGNPIGTRCTGKMVAALRAIGFDRVYDTNFGADLTIMEEGTEFITRFKNNDRLPMLTSCSPGWIRYMEYEYPDLLDHLSSCKSPHMMLGAILKSYYAETKGIDPREITVVSIMPCTAKKEEIVKTENIGANGLKDVDVVLTTREAARLIKMYGIDFNHLEDEAFDYDMFGEYTGAAVIFGATGGVMEAALRTVKEVLEGKSFDEVDYEVCRGMAGVKEATLDIAGNTVKIAIVSSMSQAKPLLEQIRKGESPYHFIEVMGCPGGCINGGGQTIVSSRIKNTGIDIKTLRAKALYAEDADQPLRKSHENPQIKELYDNYLGEPNSEKAHHLLHTTYTAKPRFK